MPGGVAASLLGRPMVRSMRSWFAPRTATVFFCAHTLPKRFHKIDHVRGLSVLWMFDLFAFLLRLQQVLERVFVAIFKFLGIELAALGIHDMGRKLEHVLWDLLVLDVVEV